MTSVRRLEQLGRVRLSDSFFMRDFLYSEIAQAEGLENFPFDVDLAVSAGKGLCENVLEPIQSALGRISVRSAYRSPEVNKVGNLKGYNCASNQKSTARHIWDMKDKNANYGATACIVVSSFVGYYESTGDWPALAWWVHDHVPAYRDMMFYPRLAAFNINWYSAPVDEKTIASQMPDPLSGRKGVLARIDNESGSDKHDSAYRQWLTQLGDV